MNASYILWPEIFTRNSTKFLCDIKPKAKTPAAKDEKPCFVTNTGDTFCKRMQTAKA